MDEEQLTNQPGKTSEDTQPVAPPPLASPYQDLSNTTIAGYRLVRRMAEGGMGVIYEAIQTKLDRKVALKVLTEQLGGRQEFLQRFEREAKAAASMSHPNMVQVFDYGEVQGRHYLIMEFIEGENLAEYIERCGKLSVVDALAIIEQAASALKAAAEKSIIHRDVKPSNLMLTKDGRVKVADLGLAKILTQDSELTVSSIGIGSPHFIAPEQADDSKHVDHRADIYSLGVTLLYLLTGRYAFDGNSPLSIMIAHTTKPLPSGAELGTELPEEVERLIQAMTAKDPADRYQDYPSLIADLQSVKAGVAPTLAPGKTSVSNSTKLLIASIAICTAVIAAAAVFYSHNKSKQSAQQPAAVQPTVAAAAAQSPVDQRSGDGMRRPPPREQGRQHPFDREQGGGEGRRGPQNDNRGFMRIVGPPPDPDFQALPNGSIDDMLAFANKYAKEHPESYLAILDCYEQIKGQAIGSNREREVDRILSGWRNSFDKAINDAIDERTAKMRQLIREGKAQEALNVWRSFPINLRNAETDERIINIMNELPEEISIR